MEFNVNCRNVRIFSTAKREKIIEAISKVRNFYYCGPEDYLAHETYAVNFNHLLIQLQRMAGPLLPTDEASRLKDLNIVVNDIHSVFNAKSELEALLPDIEDVLESLSIAEKQTVELSPTMLLKQRLLKGDFGSIEEDIDRAIENVKDDPPVAITAACSSLESLFKHYIEDKDTKLTAKQYLKQLWKLVSDDLELNPASKNDDDVKKVLSGLTSIVDGIGSMRTHDSAAHGRGRNPYQYHERHARLAINAAHTLSLFVVETWEEQDNKTATTKV